MILEEGLVSVVTALPGRVEAEELARQTVERRLAACVQVSGPVTSVYRWKGTLQTDEEWVCTMKTPECMLEDLVSYILEKHPYDTPEILVSKVDGSSPGYAKWATDETRNRG